jgi:hypothetical protein
VFVTQQQQRRDGDVPVDGTAASGRSDAAADAAPPPPAFVGVVEFASLLDPDHAVNGAKP